MVDIQASQFREFGWSPDSLAAAIEAGQTVGSTSKKAATLTIEGGARIKVVGTKLKYTADGHIKSGTVTSLTVQVPDGSNFLKALTVDGFAFKVDGVAGGTLFTKPVFTYDASHFVSPSGTKGVDFVAASGADLIIGSKGYDDLYGGSGKDTIHGGKANDVLDGGKGNDKLFGDAGDDFLAGGPGDDTLDGGKGNDWVYAPALSDPHPIKAVKIDLAKGKVTGGYGTDKLTSIENAAGGDGDDTIKGSDGPNKLQGQGGDDSVDGGKGNDTITGNAGEDTLKGGAGHDDFVFNWRNADADTVVDFKPGTDRVIVDQLLLDKILPGTAVLGVVDAAHFSGDGTPDDDDYFVYDPSTGTLHFGDSLLATFSNKPDLQASDIIVANSSAQDYWF